MQIDGRVIAAEIKDRLEDRMARPQGRMVAVLLGDDPASRSFVDRKAAAARAFGISFEVVRFDAGVPQEVVIERLTSLAADDAVHGIVLQLPLPAGYDRETLIRAIGTMKDVDNLSGGAAVAAPAVGAVNAILSSCDKRLTDFKAVRIVGNGFLVGAPIARHCGENGIPYAVCDINTEDIKGFVSAGDLVITGVGKTGVVDPAWLLDGAGVIDFGFPPDFDQEQLAAHGHRLAFYTPTPFGTGPVLIAKLFENFYSIGDNSH